MAVQLEILYRKHHVGRARVSTEGRLFYDNVAEGPHPIDSSDRSSSTWVPTKETIHLFYSNSFNLLLQNLISLVILYK